MLLVALGDFGAELVALGTRLSKRRRPQMIWLILILEAAQRSIRRHYRLVVPTKYLRTGREEGKRKLAGLPRREQAGKGASDN